MRLEVIIAKTKEEKEEYFRVTRQVYCEEYGYLSNPYDKFDVIATHFLAVKGETLDGVAAARIIEPNAVFGGQPGFIFGLPVEEDFDLSPIKTVDEKFAQISRSAVLQKYRGSIAIMRVWKAIWQYCKWQRGIDYWFNSANPETNDIAIAQVMYERAIERGLNHPMFHVSPRVKTNVNTSHIDRNGVAISNIMMIYEKLGCKYIGRPVYYEKANMTAMPLILKLDDIGNRRFFEKPSKHFHL